MRSGSRLERIGALVAAAVLLIGMAFWRHVPDPQPNSKPKPNPQLSPVVSVATGLSPDQWLAEPTTAFPQEGDEAERLRNSPNDNPRNFEGDHYQLE